MRVFLGKVALFASGAPFPRISLGPQTTLTFDADLFGGRGIGGGLSPPPFMLGGRVIFSFTSSDMLKELMGNAPNPALVGGAGAGRGWFPCEMERRGGGAFAASRCAALSAPTLGAAL